MANKLLLKKSSVIDNGIPKAPLPGDLDYGELAINYAAGKLYFKRADNTIDSFTSATAQSTVSSVDGNTGDISASQLLTAIEKVDGSGSGLDADLLDGYNSSTASTASTVVVRDANNQVNLNTINLDPTASVTAARGRIWYNSEDDTLNIGHDNGVVQQVGQEFFLPPCKNASGVVIPNGSFVMATGASGDKITIAKAITNGTVQPEFMLGVATRDISTDDEFAQIITNGIVRDIDTSAWLVGTVLYPNPTAAGGWTSVKPDAPNIRTPVAMVLRQHVSTGRIYVRMTHGSTLGGTDSNVHFVNLQDKDTIVYNSTSQTWQNKPYYGSDIDQVTVITKALTLATDWQDTGISGTNLVTGSYLIQLFANDVSAGGTNDNEYYTGSMSWFAGTTNGSNELPTDEIALHRAGSGGDGALYLRTYRTPSGFLKLQIYSNQANPSSSNYVFKFRRMM